MTNVLAYVVPCFVISDGDLFILHDYRDARPQILGSRVSSIGSIWRNQLRDRLRE